MTFHKLLRDSCEKKCEKDNSQLISKKPKFESYVMFEREILTHHLWGNLPKFAHRYVQQRLPLPFRSNASKQDFVRAYNHMLRPNFSTFPLRYVSTILALLPEIHSPRETKIEPYSTFIFSPRSAPYCMSAFTMYYPRILLFKTTVWYEILRGTIFCDKGRLVFLAGN